MIRRFMPEMLKSSFVIFQFGFVLENSLVLDLSWNFETFYGG